MTENLDQGTMTCPNCGAQFPVAGARFCPVCGGPLNAQQPPSRTPPPAPESAAPAPGPTAPPPPAPAAYHPPPAYPPPPQAYPQPQGYGPMPGYPAGYGYAPPRAHRSSTPIIAAAAGIVLVLVVVAGGLVVFAAGGSHATPTPSEIAQATPTATPEPTPAPTLAKVSVGGSTGYPVEDAGLAALMKYCGQQTGATVAMNLVDRSSFMNNIDSYLQGSPEDVFAFFPGFKMRWIAKNGQATPMSDVWGKIGASYSEAFKIASTADDGQQYLLPLDAYPWVVMYRKSVFAAKGYSIPKTLDDFMALVKKMQADNLVPLGSADKDGWPAIGTFDILDMRINGYQFHMDLMAGKVKWVDSRVTAVFQQWAKLIPYSQSNAVSRTWQDGAQALFDKKVGMLYFGTFATSVTTDQTLRDDIGMFPFPLFGNQYDSENAIEAPTDGLMLSAKNPDLSGAKKLLECVATAEAQSTRLTLDPSVVAVVKNADTSAYTSLQKGMYELIGASGRVSQFMDRDSRVDFTGAAGIQAFLASFLKNPSQDLAAFQKSIQVFWDALPALS